MAFATASSAIVEAPTAAQAAERDDQIRATLYGQCVGDAIGLLTEFMTKAEAKQYYKAKRLEYGLKVKDFHRSRWEDGDWTDDSDHMLLILLSITDHGGKVSVEDFAGKMKGWMTKGFPELGDVGGMGIGRTTSTVLRHPNFVSDPHAAAREVWDSSGRDIAPNGGVMRTSVLGTHRWWDVDAVQRAALDIVMTTHHDKRCRASAVAVSVCISLMLQRQPRHMTSKGQGRGQGQGQGHYKVDELVKDCYARAAQCLDTEEERQVLWKHMSCKKVKDLKLAEPGKIGFTYKSMGSGFWALQKDDFRKAIQKITMEGGDADSNACVAGAMLGCKLGLVSIPSSWTSDLKHKAWLDTQLDRWLALQKELAANKLQPEAQSQSQSLEHQTSEPGDQADSHGQD